MEKTFSELEQLGPNDLIAFINEIMWLVYGFMIDNFVIILTNAVMLLMSGIMILLKLKYGKS